MAREWRSRYRRRLRGISVSGVKSNEARNGLRRAFLGVNVLVLCQKRHLPAPMSLLLSDLLASPQRLGEILPPAHRCVVCQVPLQETITGKHRTADGWHCSDHYYESVGELLESAPIVAGGTRRG